MNIQNPLTYTLDSLFHITGLLNSVQILAYVNLSYLIPIMSNIQHIQLIKPIDLTHIKFLDMYQFHALKPSCFHFLLTSIHTILNMSFQHKSKPVPWEETTQVKKTQ